MSFEKELGAKAATTFGARLRWFGVTPLQMDIGFPRPGVAHAELAQRTLGGNGGCKKDLCREVI
jgi:hypothetical protein